jgi:hypothetical protein
LSGFAGAPPNLASSIGAAAPAFGGVLGSGGGGGGFGSLGVVTGGSSAGNSAGDVPQRKIVKAKRSPLGLEASDRLARGGGGFTDGIAAFDAGVRAAARGGSVITGRIERATMPTGVVCNTKPLQEKGYGFITPDNGTNYIIIIPCIGGSEE